MNVQFPRLPTHALRVGPTMLLCSSMLFASTPAPAASGSQDAAFENEMRRELAKMQNSRIEAQRLAKDAELGLSDLRAREGLRADGTAMSWPEAIVTIVKNNWLRPPIEITGTAGCTASIQISQNGDVMSVSFDEPCASEILQWSIETAILKSSPFPLPADPAFFRHKIVARFTPRD